MRYLLVIFLALGIRTAHADAPEIAIPQQDIALLKTTDYVEVTGTNTHGGKEDFSIHNSKAIGEFIHLLTADHFVLVPKSLKPDFKSPSIYNVHFFSKGAPIFDLKVIADSVIDIPNDPQFYMEGTRHSDILLAPLLRLR